MSSGGVNAGPGADQSSGGQGAVGGSNAGLGGPQNTNQLGLDQTGQQAGAGSATAGVSGGGAGAYSDQGVPTGRAAQGSAGSAGQASSMPGMPPQMQSKMEEVKNKVMQQGEKQGQQ